MNILEDYSQDTHIQCYSFRSYKKGDIHDFIEVISHVRADIDDNFKSIKECFSNYKRKFLNL